MIGGPPERAGKRTLLTGLSYRRGAGNHGWGVSHRAERAESPRGSPRNASVLKHAVNGVTLPTAGQESHLQQKRASAARELVISDFAPNGRAFGFPLSPW